MENSKFIIIFILCLPLSVSAYNAQITHPALTEEAIKIFNHYYPDLKLSGVESSEIKKGSREEDTGIRMLKHFYDPVYDRGLSEAGISVQSSKSWSKDVLAQGGEIIGPDNFLAGTVRSYFSAETDYTWDRAIYEYVHGNKERGLQSLGHVLHLIQDASVPDHTRNDGHLTYAKNLTFGYYNEDSPYELYTSNPEGVELMAAELIVVGRRPSAYSNLEEYFDQMAKYSNNNFFSKDTILDEGYKKPIILSEKVISDKKGIKYIYVYGDLNIPLARSVVRFDDITGREVKTYNFDDNMNIIMPSYWSNLSREAVLNSAGVIKLFFDEVEAERQTGRLAAKNKSALAKAFDATLSFIGLAINLKDDDKAAGTTPTTAPAVILTETSEVPQTKVEIMNSREQQKIDQMFSELKTIQNQIQNTGADLPLSTDACGNF